MQELRSLLFVPGDSERKIAKALSSTADALIVDLEDSVVPHKRVEARELCLATLQAGSSKKLFVRINALDTEDALLDLAAIVRGRPYGIMLPKCRSSGDLLILDRYLSALEVRDGIARGTTKVLPIVTETGASLFGAGSYREDAPRLVGLLWGGEDLAADIGARANRDADGRYTPSFELARTLCLLAATAARVTAVDAVYTDFRDSKGLRAELEVAARDGFAAKAAIHPDQAAIINEIFTPTIDEITRAHRVVDLFEGGEAKSVIALDGKMLDRPHLTMAKRLLSRAHQNREVASVTGK
jgi:citrate lyase subunit beta/citryl-CoA lyase